MGREGLIDQDRVVVTPPRVGVTFAWLRDVHELALMESVVESVIEQIGRQKVAVVRIEVGVLAGVAIDAMRFGFEVCTHGTSLEGASLEVVEIGARARCRTCGCTEVIVSYGTPCTCGGFDRELVSGDELRLKEVEVL